MPPHDFFLEWLPNGMADRAGICTAYGAPFVPFLVKNHEVWSGPGTMSHTWYSIRWIFFFNEILFSLT